ncbi:MAG: hypothetical protein MI749_00900 [Desulfovibrionales bacterium]|nr:hypothetical protein [Desulfovibrionales bacterium]
MRPTPLGDLISVLSEQAAKIAHLEALALSLVSDTSQVQRYRAILEEKARLLSALAQLGRPYTQKMDAARGVSIQHHLNRFSQSATASMSIGSPFYMSALLYPHDYQEGAPNDLERFIEELQRLSS